MASRWFRRVYAVIMTFGCMVLVCGTARADYFDDVMQPLEHVVSSPQNFTVNGVPVKMTAINSDGHSYVRLGELVRFLNIDAFCDAPWIQLDKTKPFSGVRVLKTATAEEREAALIVFGEEKTPPDFNLDKVFTDNLGYVQPYLKFYNGNYLSPAKIDGYIYVPLATVAQALDVGLEYDIATNTVILDKSKPFVYGLMTANGGPVCPVWYTSTWYCNADASYFSGKPGTVDDGLIIEARYEAYPFGKVFRTTDYRSSKDFPITGIAIFAGGIEFDYHYEGDDGLKDPPGFSEWGAPDADRGPFLNALRKVLNYDLVAGSGVADTPQNRMAQAKLFGVYINGAQVTGTISHRWLGTISPGGEEYFLALAAWEQVYTDDQIHDWITNQTLRYRDQIVGLFAAILKDTGEFIGQMGLLWNDFRELRALEVSYMLKRGYWGMGYAAEGAAAFTRYAFSFIGVNKVYASIRPKNERSVRVAERIGMRAEGSFVKLHAGKDMEHIIYSCERSTGNAISGIS